MTPAVDACPFLGLCEREFAGAGLPPDEHERLEEHLVQGCPSCEALIDRCLGGAAGDPLGPRLERALDAASGAMSDRREAVLARVEDALRREDDAARRRVRRRHLRSLFWLTLLAASVLLAVAYVGTAAVIRLRQREAQRHAVRTEVQALVTALSAWAREQGDLPADPAALVTALERTRPGRDHAYFRFDPARRREDGYLDAFGRSYRYLPARDRALVWSVGPDGRDDGGEGDDVGAWVVFVRPQ